MERLIVWHRWLPPAEMSPDVLAQAVDAMHRARERLTREGAHLVATIGGTLVCEAHPAHALPMIEACLSLLTDFETPGALDVGSLSIALAIGSLVSSPEGPRLGDAIDRAQALANRVRPFELVLDSEAQAITGATFLFARAIGVSPGIHGEVLDRAFPRRRECRACLSQLAMPSLPATAQAPYQALRQVALSRGRHRVLVQGPEGWGITSWLTRLAKAASPALWLHVSVVAAPLAPLSGLAYAFARLHAQGCAPEHLLDGKHEADQRTVEILSRLREGRTVGRRDVITSLQHLFNRMHKRKGARVWISVGHVSLVDPASVSVIADAVRDCTADHLLVLRLPPDGKPPDALVRGGGLSELRLPALNQPEARELAQSMLGKGASNDIARRAAAMGGTTPLGVAEAVRVLVSSGDVIHDGEIFRWRRGPAGRINTIPVHEMIEERVDQLDDHARRVLETLASVPDPAEQALVSEVRQADCLSESTYAGAIEQLLTEGLIELEAGALAITSLVRDVVEQCMPPARLAQVHGFIAEALAQRPAASDDFSQGTLAYHMARAGSVNAAVDVLLEVARSAGQHGFIRSGVRLAAAAVECDPSGQARERAAQIALALSTHNLPAKQPGAAEAPRLETTSEHPAAAVDSPDQPLSARALQKAIAAIVARDFDTVERCLELLVAAGKDGPAVDRLRAMTLLSKGDRAAAMGVLERARQRMPRSEQEATRAALAGAIVLLDGGQIGSAVREALRALARARGSQDAAGETACLHTLAACYKGLDRPEDARAIEQVALGTHSRAGLRPRSPSGSSSS